MYNNEWHFLFQTLHIIRSQYHAIQEVCVGGPYMQFSQFIDNHFLNEILSTISLHFKKICDIFKATKICNIFRVC